jgi:hypothetical protein
MFFKKHLNGVAETLDIKYKSSLTDGINSADIGELCELFIKEFLISYLDNHYKIFRGGHIVNTIGNRSPQMDIVLANRNTLRIFGDKGIYPIEDVIGVFSITSNLTLPKLKKCIKELGKIPKHHYCFNMEKFYGEKFKIETETIWKNAVPFSCIFGFKGNIKESWIKDINKELLQTADKSLWPSMIVVNKKAIIEKRIVSNSKGEVHHFYEFAPVDSKEVFGYYLSKILFNLFNLSSEQTYRKTDYANYFSKDY